MVHSECWKNSMREAWLMRGSWRSSNQREEPEHTQPSLSAGIHWRKSCQFTITWSKPGYDFIIRKLLNILQGPWFSFHTSSFMFSNKEILRETEPSCDEQKRSPGFPDWGRCPPGLGSVSGTAGPDWGGSVVSPVHSTQHSPQVSSVVQVSPS